MEQLQLSGKVLAFCLVFSTVWRHLDAVRVHPFPWVQELTGIDGFVELHGSTKDISPSRALGSGAVR